MPKRPKYLNLVQIRLPLPGIISILHRVSGDASGEVQATVFAARLGSNGGFGVPSDIVRKLLSGEHSDAVSTGDCAR